MKNEIKSLINLLDGPLISALSNAVSYLYLITDNINWLGIYLYQDDSLILGPFQGKPACTPLRLNRGVCAASFNQKETLNIPDVLSFPGHIACDSESRSELVIPLIVDKEIIGVLDIDAPIKNRFLKEDELFFTEAAKYLALYIYKHRPQRW